MSITPTISIVDGILQVHGKSLLSCVPENVTVSPAQDLGLAHGSFLGAKASKDDHHHVFPLGILKQLRFLCCFRFKIWWMTQKMGSSAKDIPSETQFLLVESKDGSPFSGEMDCKEQTIYTVFLPLLDGLFRATLQGNGRDELELCLESGDPTVQTNEGKFSIYVHSGVDPFEVLSTAVRTVETHLQTFCHREKKKMPSFLDWFGWCTWDAFYTDVTKEGIKEGLASLTLGGTPPRFLIIDDGWQSVATDQQPSIATVTSGSSFASRLTSIKENYKFQKDGKDGQSQEDPALGLQLIVNEVKKQHDVKYVFVWHAITGYWGGVKPGIPGMEQYDSAVKHPAQSPGVSANASDFVLDIISVHGVGLVHPNKALCFFDELHSYLAGAGIDGVKVDVQNILETLGAGFGGRVSLTRKYHQALETSIDHNFSDNSCISCMSHNTDGIYSSKQTAVVRASDDFFPNDPASHTIHIASVAYNSLFLGEFMQPDWDMFHSFHPASEYHAAARAVGGCAVYVSDKPGNHNFDLLRKLVLPDGSVLRAELPGRPSCDCLFSDPTRDGKSLLKIWNINKCTGVVGVFNCQGAGWCRVSKKNLVHDPDPSTITSSVHAQDVHQLAKVAEKDWNGDTVIFSHRKGELAYLLEDAGLPLTLKPKEYDVFTIVPVKVFAPLLSFAPIGLIEMFNAGGAIKSIEYEVQQAMDIASDDLHSSNDSLSDNVVNTPTTVQQSFGHVKMRVHGCGLFAVYSSAKPTRVLLDSQLIEFTYNAVNGVSTTMLPIPDLEGKLWELWMEVQLF